jgi:Holliday junction resolvasome RuvABC ATP-dependent DNA helicase subunit
MNQFPDWELSGPPNFYLSYGKRFHFFDEVHKLTTPENLYPYLSGGKYTFTLATNMSGEVAEPLYNRCIPLIFEPYTVTDIFQMVALNLTTFRLTAEKIMAIAEQCKLNPRVCRILCERLNVIFNNLKVPMDSQELLELVEAIINIDERGLNPEERMYLNFLRKNGGKSSLNLLCNALRIDKMTLTRDIEPDLINLGLVSITSKGRLLHADTND